VSENTQTRSNIRAYRGFSSAALARNGKYYIPQADGTSPVANIYEIIITQVKKGYKRKFCQFVSWEVEKIIVRA
jgi:hypothetical protein